MQKLNVIAILRQLAYVYEHACQPICKEMGVPHTAFIILMFLADNPEYYTAKDISEFRAIKPNIVSFNVNKLVEEGYLERRPIPGDRRAVRLVCTEKSQPVIAKGRSVIERFRSSLTAGMSGEDIARFKHYIDLIGENIVKLKN